MIDNNQIYERWINQLPEEARFDIVTSALKRSYNTDETLFHKDDKADAFYGVLSGRVRISATTYGGGELFATVLMAGEWFGEISVLDGKGRTHDACALEPTEMLLLPMAKLQNLMVKHPSIYRALVEVVCEKIRVAYSVIDDFLMCTPKQRLAKRLIYLSDLSVGDVKASQEELSQLVGISRQSASKFLKEWESQGVIERRYGLIQLQRRDALESLIE